MRNFLNNPILRLAVLAVALGTVGFATMGAVDKPRYDSLSHRLMCNCGCNELLGECSHAGCQSSATLGAELVGMISEGKGDEEILAAFTDKYGPTEVALPSVKGFNLVAWIGPFAAIALGMIGIIWMVRSKQKKGIAAAHATIAASTASSDLIERIRKETSGEGQ